jgi:GTPase SAR1 family protein
MAAATQTPPGDKPASSVDIKASGLTDKSEFSRYAMQLDALAKVRRLATNLGKPVNIPAIMVIGNQSAGKSSLLESISGVTLPHDAKTCTRSLIRITLEEEGPQAFFVEGKKVMARDDLPKAIEDATKALLEGKPFTDKHVNVRVTGAPYRLELIDTPGIIHNSDGDDSNVKLVQDLIQGQIKNSRVIILVVCKANDDVETAVAIQYAKDVDPDRARTIRTFTFCDVRESDLRDKELKARMQQSSAKCDREARSHEDHFVISRDDSGKLLCSEDEITKFQDRFDFRDKPAGELSAVGMQSLRKRLDPILRDLVEQSLPVLLQELKGEEQRYLQELRVVGETDLGPASVLSRVSDGLAETAELIATKWREVHDNADDDTRKIYNSVVNDRPTMLAKTLEMFDPTESPLFQGQRVFKWCMDKVKEGYTIVIDELLDAVVNIVEQAVLKRIADETELFDEGFSHGLRGLFLEFLTETRTSVQEQLHKSLQLSSEFFTKNSHYIDERAEFSSPKKAQELAEFLSTEAGSTDVPDLAPAIRAFFLGRIRSLPEQVVDRLQKHLRLVCKAQHKHFCDAINGVFKTELKQGLLNWVKRLPLHPKITANAREKRDVIDQRRHLKEQMNLYRESCEILYEAGAKLEAPSPATSEAAASASSAARKANGSERLPQFFATIDKPNKEIEDPMELVREIAHLCADGVDPDGEKRLISWVELCSGLRKRGLEFAEGTLRRALFRSIPAGEAWNVEDSRVQLNKAKIEGDAIVVPFVVFNKELLSAEELHAEIKAIVTDRALKESQDETSLAEVAAALRKKGKCFDEEALHRAAKMPFETTLYGGGFPRQGTHTIRHEVKGGESVFQFV